MKIIELTETQFRNYAKFHSSRNYFQTIEFANMKDNYKRTLLGYINEKTNTLMAAVLILEKEVIGKFKIGLVPGGFLIDYNNDSLFKDFITVLKDFLKEKKFIYLTVHNEATYKMYDKERKVIYFDTNILKLLDELSFVKVSKEQKKKIVLESELTPNETYKLFNSNTKRNINLALQRAITIYKDENNNVDTLLSLNYNGKKDKIVKIVNNFKNKDNNAEIYLAKIDLEKYINNYRFLLKKEEERNDMLNSRLQDVNTNKSVSLINKKMRSDKLITKYNNEIIKATKAYAKYPKGAIIGAILIVKNNREIYFLSEGYHKELAYLYSSHLIKWEIIKKYLSEGYKIFNFGTVKNADKRNGNYLFKMGFGGKLYECIGTYDLLFNKWLYYMAKIVYKIKMKNSI